MRPQSVLTKRITADDLVYRGKCLVYWVMITPATTDTAGVLNIIDGQSTGDQIRMSPAVELCRVLSFDPPFRMELGLYLEPVSNIDDVTIGYWPVNVSDPGS